MNKTEQEQICIAFEQLAIGTHYFSKFPKKKFPINSLIEILEEAHFKEQVESRGLDINKNYSNYRKKLKEKFEIDLNFQTRTPKIIFDENETMTELLQIYLKQNTILYNDYLVFQFINLIKEKKQFQSSIYNLVILNIASLLKTEIEIVYEKMHGNLEVKTYKVIPCGIIAFSNYLQFLAYDKIDDRVKYFVVSCIKEIKTDCFDFIKDTNRGSFQFDYEEFEKSKDYQIEGNEITYIIKIKNNKLKHFSTKFFPHLQLISEPNEHSIFEIKSDKPKSVFRALFDYRDEIELLDPEESRIKYKNVLEKILRLYN